LCPVPYAIPSLLDLYYCIPFFGLAAGSEGDNFLLMLIIPPNDKSKQPISKFCLYLIERPSFGQYVLFICLWRYNN